MSRRSTVQQFITLPYALAREPPRHQKPPKCSCVISCKSSQSRATRFFDPFAGLGTTLFVAEEMRRIPFGIEHDARRHQWVAGQLKNWANLKYGDSAKLSSDRLPRMDFSMTSPPFMPRHHRRNPLCAGNPAGAGYDRYFDGIRHIYRQLARIMKRAGRIVVQADNLPGRSYTPLVRDLSTTISGCCVSRQKSSSPGMVATRTTGTRTALFRAR
jgi:hypothetical protein